MILFIHPFLPVFQVNLPFPFGKLLHYRFSGKQAGIVFAVSGIDSFGTVPEQFIIASAAVDRIRVLLFHKTLIVILGQINSHNQRIGRTDSGPEGLILDQSLPFALNFDSPHFRDIGKYCLYDFLSVRIHNPSHRYIDPDGFTILLLALPRIGCYIAPQSQGFRSL